MKFNEYLKNNLKSIFVSYIYVVIILNILKTLYVSAVYDQSFSEFIIQSFILSSRELVLIFIYFGVFLLVARLKFTFRR